MREMQRSEASVPTNWHSPQMKTSYLYNGIYYEWENTPIPPNAGSGIQSYVSFFKLSVGEGVYPKKSPKIPGSFRFKVINSHIYIQYKGR